MRGSDELKESIGSFRRSRRPEGPDLSPASAFEALLDERIKGVERSVAEVKGRINGLVFVVIAAMIVQVILGLMK